MKKILLFVAALAATMSLKAQFLFSATPDEVDFGTVTLVEGQATGSMDVYIHGGADVGDMASFHLTGDAVFSSPQVSGSYVSFDDMGNYDGNITINYTATAAGEYTGTLQFDINDGTMVYSVPISLKVVEPAPTPAYEWKQLTGESIPSDMINVPEDDAMAMSLEHETWNYVYHDNGDLTCKRIWGGDVSDNTPWQTLITAVKNGWATVYYPVAKSDPTAIVNNENENQNEKVIENGQVVILRNGVKFNALGQVVE